MPLLICSDSKETCYGILTSRVRRASVLPPVAGDLTKYEAPDSRRCLVQLLATILPFLALWVAMLHTLSSGYGLTLLLAVPTAYFLVRLFMLQHDCAHRSFVRSPATNDVLGMVIGLFTLTPHYYWRRLHLMHHATSGNLDRRGYGITSIAPCLSIERGR